MNSRIGVALTLSLVFGTAGAQPAIKINGVEISAQKVQAQTDHLVNERGRGSGGITQPQQYQRFRDEVVEQLVVQELLWQEAQRRRFVVEDALVDARLAELKSNFDSDQAFLFRIKEGGFTEATYREDIRQQTSVRKMIAEDITPSVKVSDADIEQFYAANLDRMQLPLQLRARHILIQPQSSEPADVAAARAEAEAIIGELKSGADFIELATTRSQATSAGQGGDLGFFTPEQMVEPFALAVQGLEPGGISNVVETEFGFHVIRLEERRGGRAATLAEASDQIRDFLKQQRLEAEVEALVTKLRDTGDVQILVNP